MQELEIQENTVKQRSVQLTEGHIRDILMGWAKQHGFSHRAIIDVTGGQFMSATITEEIKG